MKNQSELLKIMGQMQTIRARIANAIKAGKAQSGIDVYQEGLKALQQRVNELKAASNKPKSRLEEFGGKTPQEARDTAMSQTTMSAAQPANTESQTESRRFIFPVDKLDEVRAIIDKVGAKLDVSKEAISVHTAVSTFGVSWDNATEWQRQWAKDFIAQHTWVTVETPKSGVRVVATAERMVEATGIKAPGGIDDDGQDVPMVKLSNFGQRPYWTQERIEKIDFCACDVCHAKRDRHKIFVLKRSPNKPWPRTVVGQLGDHERKADILQVGGACAKKFDAAGSVAKMLRAFDKLDQLLAEQSIPNMDGEEGMGGGRRMALYDPYKAMALMDALITKHGYISKSRSHQGTPTAKEAESIMAIAEGLLMPPKGEDAQAYRDVVEGAFASKRAQAVIKGTIKTAKAKLSEAKLRAKEATEKLKSIKARTPVDYGELDQAAAKADKANDAVTMFHNVLLSTRSPDSRMFGYLAFGVSKWRQERGESNDGTGRKLPKAGAPWKPHNLWGAASITGDELGDFIQRVQKHNKALGDDELAIYWGLRGGAAALAKQVAKGDKPITKSLTKRVGKTVIGQWYIQKRWAWDNEFGTTYVLNMIRMHDGATLSWKSSAPRAVWKGQGFVDGKDPFDVWVIEKTVIALMAANIKNLSGKYGPEVNRVGAWMMEGDRKVDGLSIVRRAVLYAALEYPLYGQSAAENQQEAISQEMRFSEITTTPKGLERAVKQAVKDLVGAGWLRSAHEADYDALARTIHTGHKTGTWAFGSLVPLDKSMSIGHATGTALRMVQGESRPGGHDWRFFAKTGELVGPDNEVRSIDSLDDVRHVLGEIGREAKAQRSK